MRLIFFAFVVVLLAACSDRVTANDEIIVIKSYEELTKQGLEASTMKIGPSMVFRIHSPDANRNLPQWMQALYVVDRTTGRLGTPYYEFDRTKKNRVGASFNLFPNQIERAIIVICPLAEDNDTLKDKTYIAIAAADLLKWCPPVSP
jgi:hypothetical protein